MLFVNNPYGKYFKYMENINENWLKKVFVMATVLEKLL